MKAIIFIILITFLSCTKIYKQTDLKELSKYGEPISGYENTYGSQKYIIVYKDSMNVITEIAVSEGVYSYYYNLRIK